MLQGMECHDSSSSRLRLNILTSMHSVSAISGYERLLLCDDDALDEGSISCAQKHFQDDELLVFLPVIASRSSTSTGSAAHFPVVAPTLLVNLVLLEPASCSACVARTCHWLELGLVHIT